ncbi:UNVERIFIED_CONTAM: hypothetical protein HDU68_011497, partial [Siphonaria sp. JEL0065]
MDAVNEQLITWIHDQLQQPLPAIVKENELAIKSAIAVLILTILYYALIPSKVKLIHSPKTVLIASATTPKSIISKSPLSNLIKSKCPSLARGRFYPTPYLPEGNIQTIYAGLISKFPELRADYDRQLMDMPDGGLVAVDWAPRDHKSLPKTTPVLIVLHGLAGGSRETYICDLVPHALKLGYKVAALNFRGCGGVEITTPQLYSGSFTEDARLMMQHIKRENPMAPLIGMGFSLGANILMKCVGEDGPKSPLMACVSIANPYDLHLGLTFLHSTWLGKEVYSKVMTQSLIGIYKKHRNMFEKNLNHPQYIEPISSTQILKAKYLPDFDEAATRRVFGYRSVSEYYRMGSSAQYLPDVRIPTLLLSDVNDPIAVAGSIPVADVLGNPYVILATTQRGGHIGWFEGLFFPKRWFPKPVMEFIKALVDAHESLPPHQKHAFAEVRMPRKDHVHYGGKHPVLFHHHHASKREDERVDEETTAPDAIKTVAVDPTAAVSAKSVVLEASKAKKKAKP